MSEVHQTRYVNASDTCSPIGLCTVCSPIGLCTVCSPIGLCTVCSPIGLCTVCSPIGLCTVCSPIGLCTVCSLYVSFVGRVHCEVCGKCELPGHLCGLA